MLSNLHSSVFIEASDFLAPINDQGFGRRSPLYPSPHTEVALPQQGRLMGRAGRDLPEGGRPWSPGPEAQHRELLLGRSVGQGGGWGWDKPSPSSRVIIPCPPLALHVVYMEPELDKNLTLSRWKRPPRFWLKSSLLRELLEAGALQPKPCWKHSPGFRDLLSLLPPPQPHPTCPVKTAGASQEARPPPPPLGVGGRLAVSMQGWVLITCGDGESSQRHPDLKTSPFEGLKPHRSCSIQSREAVYWTFPLKAKK